MREYFSMIMLCDIGDIKTEFRAFSDALSALGVREGVDIRVMHEDIFNSMHKI
jgi:ACT domain-containing protein